MHFIHLLLSAAAGTHPQSWYDILSDVLAYSAIIPIALFIFYYGSRPVPGKRFRRQISTLWRSTAIGRTLMYQEIAWFIYLVFVTVSTILGGDFWGRSLIRDGIYIYLVFLFWRLFITLRQLQKSGSEQTKPPVKK